ncbi:MAG: potassium-transporting ATPase subunit KdpC [Pirellulales bacterium]|nr:potassium-transporting ATPase subunit KdpC [Pirellulales bacterium]
MFHQVMKPAVLIFVVLSLLTGVVYPLLVTGVAQLLFPSQANGTLVYENGKPVASALIGQPFDAPRYFWGRPSATSRVPYNAAASSGSNLAPTNPTLLKFVRVRIETLRVADPGNKAPIPVDLVTASGSGLDPHISPAAAEYQVGRVAKARGMGENAVRQLIVERTERRTLGLLGEDRVNVVQLNLDLDRASR